MAILPKAVLAQADNGAGIELDMSTLFHAVYRVEDSSVIAVFRYVQDCVFYVASRSFPMKYRIAAL